MLIFGRFRLGFRIGEKLFRYRKKIEIMLHAKTFEAQNTQCFTVLSVKHFFYEKSASC